MIAGIDSVFHNDDRYRARIGSLRRAVGEVVGHLALRRIAVDAILLYNRTQVVIWVLFEDVRAERPAGLAADASRPVDGNFHHSLYLLWSSGRVLFHVKRDGTGGSV